MMNAPFTTNDSSNLKTGADNPAAGADLSNYSWNLLQSNSDIFTVRSNSASQSGLPELSFTTADAGAEVQSQGDKVPEGGLEQVVTAIADDAKDGTFDDLEKLRQVLNSYGPGNSEQFVDDLNKQLSDSGVSAEFEANRDFGSIDVGGNVALMKDGEYTDRILFSFSGDVIQPEGMESNFG